MKKQHARLTVLLDAKKKHEFEELCAELGSTPSQVLRSLIERYLKGKVDVVDPLRSANDKGAPGGKRTD